MANGFVCVRCGWQESVHIHGGRALTDEERKALFVPREGFVVSFLDCGGYASSQEELEAEAEEKSGGPHEGCH